MLTQSVVENDWWSSKIKPRNTVNLLPQCTQYKKQASILRQESCIPAGLTKVARWEGAIATLVITDSQCQHTRNTQNLHGIACRLSNNVCPPWRLYRHKLSGTSCYQVQTLPTSNHGLYNLCSCLVQLQHFTLLTNYLKEGQILGQSTGMPLKVYVPILINWNHAFLGAKDKNITQHTLRIIRHCSARLTWKKNLLLVDFIEHVRTL